LRTLAEALRLLAIAHHRRLNGSLARELCQRSRLTAESAGDGLLAARALNTLAAFDLAEGQIETALTAFQAALQSAGGDAALRGRIEQNLGIIANIQGDPPAALKHYQRALEAFAAAAGWSPWMLAMIPRFCSIRPRKAASPTS